MINPAVFIKEPLYFGNLCKIYPPSIKQVVGNQHYAQIYRLLTITQDDIKDQLKGEKVEDKDLPTPLEFLIINSYYNQEFLQVAREAFQMFTKENITILSKQRIIVLGDKEEIEERGQKNLPYRILNEDNYFDFQNMIRQACGEESEQKPTPIDPNEDPRIRRIKEKARERDRIKKRKGTSGGISLETLLVSICCMGIGITPLNIGEMSYAALSAIIKSYQLKEKYDLDVRSLLAGADSKKIKPQYWIRNSD